MMGKKPNPKVKIEQIEVALDDIQGCFPGPIITRGNSHYVRLDANFIRFWELMAGDELLISVSKVKRVKADRE